jgi:hypothetical protein
MARSISIKIGAAVSLAGAGALTVAPGADPDNPSRAVTYASDGGSVSVNEASSIEKTPARLTLAGLDATHEIIVRYYELLPDDDSPCIIEIVDGTNGEILATGGGATPADALSVMFERMLPPSSSEYLSDADEEPLPDDR